MRKERVKLDLNNCLSKVVGGETGLSTADVTAFTSRLETVHKEFEEERKLGHHAFRSLPEDTGAVKKVQEFANSMKGQLTDLIVVGIGGSSLGARALINALCHPHHNALSAEARGKAPRVFFVENPDPSSIKAVLDLIEPERTMVLAITKSGNTAETMAGFMTVYEHLKDNVSEATLKKNIVVISDPEGGDLRRMSQVEGWRAFDIPKSVGSRYSVFTPAGLLPAALCGVDIETLVDGARDMEESVIASHDPLHNPAYSHALIHFLFDELKEIRQNVFMPYSDRLSELADWYRQLWAESLGKRVNQSGDVVNAGTTPIKALGAVDQHSQVQLYVEGPADKFFTFIEVRDHGSDRRIPDIFNEYEEASYLGNKYLGELLNIERKATEYSLTRAGRPNITLQIPEVTPNFVGELMQMLMISTVVAGKLYEVNPYDQPGVEEGKNATFAMLDRKGFSDKKTEYTSRFTKDPKYII